MWVSRYKNYIRYLHHYDRFSRDCLVTLLIAAFTLLCTTKAGTAVKYILPGTEKQTLDTILRPLHLQLALCTMLCRYIYV
jgi:hypothetical protein